MNLLRASLVSILLLGSSLAAAEYSFRVTIHHRSYSIHLPSGLTPERAEAEILRQLPSGLPPGPFLTRLERLAYAETGIRGAATAGYFSPAEVNERILDAPAKYLAPQLRFPEWPSAPERAGALLVMTVARGERTFAVWPTPDGRILVSDFGVYEGFVAPERRSVGRPFLLQGFRMDVDRDEIPTDMTPEHYAASLRHAIHRGYGQEAVFVQGEVRGDVLVVRRAVTEHAHHPLALLSRDEERGWGARGLWQGLYGTHFRDGGSEPVRRIDISALGVPEAEKPRVESALATGRAVVVGAYSALDGVYYVTGVQAVLGGGGQPVREGKLSWRDLLR